MQTPERAELLPALSKVESGRFEALALAVFRYQSAHNPLYARYLELLNRRPESLRGWMEIPCLPISFFKTQHIATGDWQPETLFSSSATTGQVPSRHLVRHLGFYLENARRGFASFYGDPAEWCVLALLPSYIERGGSSLVAMADDFIRCSRHPESGFFLHEHERLQAVLTHCMSKQYKTLLLGVSFALLDFAERCPMPLPGLTIMETGGMKGRRQELTRADLHTRLKAAFGVEAIHSEYGMTELFSQAYAQGGERFRPAPTLRAFCTEPNDPFALLPPGRSGVLNLVDLANVDTCAFIQTEDVGRCWPDGSFEVLGRLDVAELRGCNLMLES
jgi:hypothetical protein